jgi:fructosamine-3-kinase
MPQAYQNLNATALRPSLCVQDWAGFFSRRDMRPTVGCFAEKGHNHLSIPDLVQSVREVADLPFNVFRHGTVTDAELAALAAIT